ncbi:MAG: ABC transporter substrate-binding protein [Ferruginibacter sp.]
MKTATKILFIYLTILIVSCNENSKVNSTIGVLFPMTGDAGEYGVKGRKAIELAIEKINSAGGINGQNVQAIFEDSKADPTTGVTAMQKLISIDKVPAVVGDIVSAVSIPAAAVAEKNKVVMIAPTSSAPAITQAGAFIYRVWPSDLLEGSAAGNFVKQKGFKKAVVLHLNNDYGNQIAIIFKTNFETETQKVIANEAYDPKTDNFRPVLTKIKNLNPDVIYIAGYFEDTGEILKQAKELGIKVQFIGATAIEDNKFLELAGKSAEGIVYPLATGFDAKSQSPATKEFVDAFLQKYNYEPGWVESHCYDAFMLIVEAMKKTGKTDGDSIRKYLDSMGVYKGATGDIKFDANGDVTKPIIYKTVKEGKFIILQ